MKEHLVEPFPLIEEEKNKDTDLVDELIDEI